MNITCAICKEIFRPSDDIYSTQCGHTFHLTCINHWFHQGKKTCPTCREPATLSSRSSYTIHRMFFDITRCSEVPANVGVLQDEVDNLTFKLKTKEKELRTLKESYDESDKQNKGMRAEIRTLEGNLEKNKELLYVYKEHLKSSQLLEEENAKLKKQLVSLNNTMEHMQNIKDLVTGSYSEVENLFINQHDPKTLQTYCSTLKRSFEDFTLKFKKEREKSRRLQQEVVDLTKQRDKYFSKCEQYMNLLENYQSKLHEMTEQPKVQDQVKKDSSKVKPLLSLTSTPKRAEKHKSSISLEENTENCTPKKFRKRKIDIDSDIDASDANTSTKKSVKEKVENKSSSPYLQAKGGVSSLRFNFMKRNGGGTSENTLFVKKPKLSSAKKTLLPFDGLGGRSRDIEPSHSPPKLKFKGPVECPAKPKKPRLLEKLRTLDDFVDLTGHTP